MRGLFGLVSLLLWALIVAYVWASYTQKTASVAGPLHDQAEQLSGRSADGAPVSESIKTEEANDPRGHFKGLLVIDVAPGGGMQKMYGLQKDDVIISVESLTVNELNSADAMKALLADAYQKSQPVVVMRNGVQITLPQTSSTTAPSGGSALQNQLDGIIKRSQQQ